MAMKLLYPELIVDINIDTFVYFSNFTYCTFDIERY